MITKILLASLLLPLSALAGTREDVTRIRALLPAGADVAQIRAAMLAGSSEAEALAAGAKNYLIRDINGDGLADILVISEVNPSYVDDNNQPCHEDQADCYLNHGQRALFFFAGAADGSFGLVFANDRMVRTADEGGVWGDPLEGLGLRKNGSITLDVYGGSAWRWSYTDVMQFRDGHLYLIGQDSATMWTGDLRNDTKSINFITGEVIETHQKNADAPTRTKKYKIKRQPLVKVADYAGSAE